MLVCWSGGCDSTLVLYDLAKKAKAMRDAPEPCYRCQPQAKASWGDDTVRAITICHSQVGAEDEQRAARQATLAKFKEWGLTVDAFEIKVDAGSSMEHLGLPQALIWLYASQCLRVEESLYSGYHRGDDFWIFSDKFRKVFKNLQEIGERTGSWLTPLETYAKREIIVKLKEANLYESTWWCDSPKKVTKKGSKIQESKPCGGCTPCITHNMALYEETYLEKINAERKKEIDRAIKGSRTKGVSLKPIFQKSLDKRERDRKVGLMAKLTTPTPVMARSTR